VLVRVVVHAGGHGMPGEGMTPELLSALRSAGFKGDLDHGAMYRVTDLELTAEAVAALAASWAGGAKA
jgi:hypothetical protein